MSGGAAPSSQQGAATQQAAALPSSSWIASNSALPEAAVSQQQQQPSTGSGSSQYSCITAALTQQQSPLVHKPSPPAVVPVVNSAFTDFEQQQLQGVRLAGLGPLKSSAVAAASSVAATVGPAALSSRIRPSAALEQQLQVSWQVAAVTEANLCLRAWCAAGSTSRVAHFNHVMAQQ
jgi:hypothetical protein